MIVPMRIYLLDQESTSLQLIWQVDTKGEGHLLVVHARTLHFSMFEIEKQHICLLLSS